MRLHFGPPPTSPDFDPPAQGWTSLREPSPFGLQMMALPVAVVTAAALGWAWGRLMPLETQPGFSLSIDPRNGALPAWLVGLFGMLAVGAAFLALIAVHELLHALVMPAFGLSHQTLIGVWPSRLLFYAAYLGPMPRSRFLWVFFAPFLILSAIPLAVCASLQIAPAPVVVVSVVNGACACGDIVGIALIASQVPRAALVRNQGWQTWWKIASGVRT